jgi:hypothetical protein
MVKFSFRSKPIGWKHDSYRHSLAAKGIRTSFQSKTVFEQGSEFAKQRNEDALSRAKVNEEMAKEKSEQLFGNLRQERPRVNTEKFSGTTAASTVATRLKGEKGVIEASKDIVLMPQEEALNRLSRSNNFLDLVNYKNANKDDPYKMSKLAGAVYDSAAINTQRGIAPDVAYLKAAGVSDFQVKQLQEAYNQKVGKISAGKFGAEVGGATFEVAKSSAIAIETGAEKELQARLQEGAKRYEDAGDQLTLLDQPSTAFQSIDKGQPKIRIVDGEEIVDEPEIGRAHV